MLGNRVTLRGANRDQAEKPFWISYADLMTALMVLFLVVMSVALLALTEKVSETESAEEARARDLKTLCQQLTGEMKAFPEMTFSCKDRAIDFGERALFPFNSARLESEKARALRDFIPVVHDWAKRPEAAKWLKRVFVVGYTDPTGTYLNNLDLSLERSQSALCALFGKPVDGELPLELSQKRQIQDLFLVGGFANNALRESDDASRRVELRLEFYGMEEERLVRVPAPSDSIGTCEGQISR